MPDTCTQQFGPAAQRSVALAIELVGATAGGSHRLLEKVLEDKKIQQKLAEELKKAGESLMAEQLRLQPISITSSAKTLGSAAAGVLKDPTIKQIKNSREFLRLETSMKQLQCAFDETPVGAFVDDNKTVLVIVGSVAAIAGGVAMYRAKAGDVPAQAYSLLSLLPIKKIGSVNVSLRSFDLKPSTRTVSAEVGVGKKWNRVEANLDLKLTFANASLTQVSGKTNLILTLSPEWEGSASSKYSWTKADANVRQELLTSGELGVRKRISRDTSLNFQLFGKYLDNKDGVQQQFGANAKLEMNGVAGRGTKLSVTPSLSRTNQQSRDGGGLGPSRTDTRFMLGVSLQFD